MSKTEINRALKKVHIALDKMIDLQDNGFGCDRVSRILENLNQLESELYQRLMEK